MPKSEAKGHELLKALVKKGKNMTAQDRREETISYVMACSKLGPEHREEIERSLDKIYGAVETKR